MRRPISLFLLVLLASVGFEGAANAQTVGATMAVQPDAEQTSQGTPPRPLGAGDPILLYDLIATSATGLAQILFDDESTLSVGPNTEVEIDEFVYDGSGTGALTIGVGSGIARYIGGRISKDQDVTLETPHGSIGIRGGMVLLQVAQETWAAHQFGIMTCSGGGDREVITSRGFACVIGPNGVEVIRVPEDQYGALIEAMAGFGGQEDEGTTSLVELFCDSGFAQNHKDCLAPPGGLAHTQGEDLGVPGEALDESTLIDEQQDGLDPEIDYNDFCLLNPNHPNCS